MHILFLTQILPYPPDAGPRVKTLQVLRYLIDQGHRVTLVSFVRADEEKHLAAVQKLVPDFYPVKMARSRIADIAYAARSFLTGKSFLIERDGLPAMRNLIKHLATTCDFDAIHADQLTMTQFALDLPELKKPVLRLFDAHNAVWSIVERMKTNTPLPVRPLLGLEAKRIKQYEGQVVQQFDYTLAVTEIDRQLLIEAAESSGGQSNKQKTVSERILTVPISVDTQVLHAVPRPSGSNDLLTLGTLHYPPNADGIRWFLNEVYPLLRAGHPDVRLTIIGKNPPADFLEQAARDPMAVEVTGYVDDLLPYFERSALMVVPVRAGGGMRVRILEAFSRGIPTVTTTVGLEGIDAVPDRDVLIGDTAEEFAAQVLRLLHDPTLQAQLAANGRKLAEEVYDRQVALRKMERIYNGQA